ncbi:hypothetical protein HNP55_003577 [Paucibacter oligotrophus]|uniref:Uncharacterized protein n=1 Tax=Roseateles oligotrophus TaxID=1769250 RepID=A0A840LBC2_9BURK|nr:hypothetical protein [Roseateles oligotrophus]MBB4845031.1 hypothetical protein [Roseateles oligotrophus]
MSSPITLTVGTTSVALPGDLYWSDETAWHPVAQSVERSLTGAAIISIQARSGGRPITLEPPVALASWMPRFTIELLKAWADQPGQQMTLTLRGMARTVIWRHQDGEVMVARPVQHFDDVQPDDAHTATLKFMEI